MSKVLIYIYINYLDVLGECFQREIWISKLMISCFVARLVFFLLFYSFLNFKLDIFDSLGCFVSIILSLMKSVWVDNLKVIYIQKIYRQLVIRQLEYQVFGFVQFLRIEYCLRYLKFYNVLRLEIVFTVSMYKGLWCIRCMCK